MKLKAILSMSVGALLVFGAPKALARSSYQSGLNSAIVTAYGANAGYTASCAGCHGASITGTMGRQFGNDFYDAFNNHGTNYASIVQDMKGLDSDGDGFTNEDEWKAKTDPSDPASHPALVVCVRAAPGVSLSPASQSAMAGGSVSYTVSVKNNDSAACAASTFALSIPDQASITESLSLQSLVIDPGQSKDSTVTLATDAGISPSSYPFSVEVSEAGISEHSASGAGTLVIMAAPVCARAAPSLTLDPSSQDSLAGESKSFSLKLVNNDSAACQGSTFDLSLSSSAPISGSLANSSLNLAPGESGSVAIAIQSEAAAAVGSYSFSVASSDAAEALHAGSVSGILMIKDSGTGTGGGSDMEAPSVPMNLKSNGKRHGKWSISWDASSDNVGVKKYQVLVDGALKGEVSGPSIRLRLKKGTHEIRVRALDAAGNQSDLSAPLSLSTRRHH